MSEVDAKTKICPLLSSHTEKSVCITDLCMFWETTIKGAKIVDKVKVPYDLTPMEERDFCTRLIQDGYEEVKESSSWRPVYVKHEQRYEGFCRLSIVNLP